MIDLIYEMYYLINVKTKCRGVFITYTQSYTNTIITPIAVYQPHIKAHNIIIECFDRELHLFKLLQ